jgi:hypothetical protein
MLSGPGRPIVVRVTTASLLRLLDLVRQDLGAQDSRLEIGGADPEDSRLVWCRLPAGSRLVVIFREPPVDREQSRRRLAAWAESFEGLLSAPAEERPRPAAIAVADRLVLELGRLASRAEAAAAAVVDRQSPVVWGSVEPGRRDQAATPLLERAIARLRQDRSRRARRTVSEPGLAYVARSFGGIYLLVLVYEGPFSELKAERATNRSIARIERLVLGLPPRDPSRRGRERRIALVPPRGPGQR